MRITTKQLRQFIDLDVSDSDIVSLIQRHIGEVDHHHNLKQDYENIVVAEIVEKKDHPDADKLGVYMINIGEKENIQVVAGDKELKVGDKVAYMKVGAIVPHSIYTEVKPFEISAVELRGIKSNGMMGSEKELNLGPDHKRVLVLPNDAPVGTSFVEYFDLDDTVIDIENKALTNRGDLFGILGISRELAAITGKAFKSPEWYLESEYKIKPKDICLDLKVINDAEALCNRYTAVALHNINVEESPIWLKSALIKADIKPINNIVDITNYISLLIGQPLHAFDFDKVVDTNTATINVRMARDGETILGLDEKTYTLNPDILVIADNEHPIAIAGIIGGKDSEVGDDTKRIILESANFDKSNIRRSSMALGINTEAGTRFKHDISVEQTLPALLKAVEMIEEIAKGEVASNLIDIIVQKPNTHTIQFSLDDLNTILGTTLDLDTVERILSNLEYEIKDTKKDITISPPSWRRDVVIKEDVYEDIGRIFGYDSIEAELPKKKIVPPVSNKMFDLKKNIREILSNNGANEALTYSFVAPDSFEKCSLDMDKAYRVANPLSPDLSLMRTTLLQSLVQKSKENIDRGIGLSTLYEINITHLNDVVDEAKLPVENWFLGMSFVATEKESPKGSSYYIAKRYLDMVLNSIGIKDITYTLVSENKEIDIDPHIKNVLGMFDANRSAIVSVNGIDIGIIGEFSQKLKESYKLPMYSAGLEINLNTISDLEVPITQYKEQPIYPPFTQDICIEVDMGIQYMDVERDIKYILEKNSLWNTVECIDIYKGDTEKRRITFRVVGSSYKKTLDKDEISKVLRKIENRIARVYKGKVV